MSTIFEVKKATNGYTIEITRGYSNNGGISTDRELLIAENEKRVGNIVTEELEREDSE